MKEYPDYHGTQRDSKVKRKIHGKRPANTKKISTVCITEAKHAAIINFETLLQPFAMVHNQELQAADNRQFRIFFSFSTFSVLIFFRLFPEMNEKKQSKIKSDAKLSS